MTALTAADVARAVARVRGRLRRTPVIALDDGLGGTGPLWLKLENLQLAGSFKVRGALNNAVGTGAPVLVAASGGNHGLAVATIGARLGRPTEIFVPAVTPEAKVARIVATGARLHRVGALYDDAQAACDAWAAARDLPVVHPYDAPLTVAGQATLGVELREQVPGLDTVVVAVGGGGLAAGLALSLPADVRLVTVEPTSSCCLHAALTAGRPVDVEVGGVAADSLGARRIGALAWELLERRALGVVVGDAAIEAARRLLWDELRLAVEPAGATAVSALACGAYVPEPDETVVVVICGANTDPATVTG